MSIANHFYNGTTKKYIAVFGTLFNKLSIVRSTEDTHQEVQRMIVPISYGPYQKFLARITQDPELNRKTAITLPRMAFEITNMVYDGSRKINSTKKLKSSAAATDIQSFYYSPAPYNIDFTLYIMTKYAEDGTQLLEQIIPFFKPEWTTTVKVLDDIEPLDIPLVLNNVVTEDLYEADFETRRSLMWTLNFTMKCWFFGPKKISGNGSKVIKYIDVSMFSEMTATIPDEQLIVRPGLTANGAPTSDIDQTIPYEDIMYDDDWGIIKIVRDYTIE